MTDTITAERKHITDKNGESFDIEEIRSDFPVLSRTVHNKPLVYFDNAATTQKPKEVINKLDQYYHGYNSNIHRGVHYLSQLSTNEYEEARNLVQKYINSSRSVEVIFTRGTTESINLVASAWGRKNIRKGDEIVVTAMEHHSNIVPWQMLCEEKGAKLRVAPMNDNGEMIFDEYIKLLNDKTKLVSFVHVSNSLGTVNPAKEIIEAAHARGIPVLMDAAQSIQHLPVDVKELDVDFMAFSGHKIYGPTGIGVLYGKKDILDEMTPYQGGGDMIKSVSFDKTIYNDLPYKFEAGTPNIAGAIGLGEAIKYIRKFGLANIAEYEKKLLEYATHELEKIPELTIIGNASEKSSAISFIIENIHPHDAGTFLDMHGIAVRTGHHCTEPVMRRFNVPATTRASFAFYNTFGEVDVFINAVRKVIKMFS